jgi:hypothetical protein
VGNVQVTLQDQEYSIVSTLNVVRFGVLFLLLVLLVGLSLLLLLLLLTQIFFACCC